ncbi:hypothetical protein BD414DRAFT_324173 [Trametes punicea]|nr:hypothetical protein BD414DRAFT_324173 [Trametes punicea]
MHREACAELSHLPKLAQGIKSINFRRTTPGTISFILFSKHPPPVSRVLDPTHPALSYSPYDWMRAFPWRACHGFSMRAIPKGLLTEPSPRHPEPPYSLNDGPRKGHSLNLSLLDCAPKSAGGRVVRQQILRKFKTAISLIVVRGADAEGPEDDRRLVFRDEEAGKGEQWILPDWTYIVRPELEVYKMLYAQLIPLLRRTLRAIAITGIRLEQEWAQTKAALVESGGTAPLKRLMLPSKPPPSPTPGEQNVARHLIEKLQQIKLASLLEESGPPTTSAPEQNGGKTAGSTAKVDEVADTRASDSSSSRALSPLESLIGRHSKRGFTRETLRGEPKQKRPSSKSASTKPSRPSASSGGRAR